MEIKVNGGWKCCWFCQLLPRPGVTAHTHLDRATADRQVHRTGTWDGDSESEVIRLFLAISTFRCHLHTVPGKYEGNLE
ncbi:hypothetical protein RRG08_036087 [Elysia crispata]|uniref:Uncharacterized protein n=1 Tax=Elysia crispata TaxID=231223 RepID=A0AAE1E0I9_9GAST|nr:hypothetical protein RRG08_036087 [Elysia crispata]